MIFSMNREAACPECKERMLPVAGHQFFGWRCPKCGKDWECGGLYRGKSMPRANAASTLAVGHVADENVGLPFRMTVCPDGLIAFTISLSKSTLTWQLTEAQLKHVDDAISYVRLAQRERLRHLRAGDVFHFRQDGEGQRFAKLDDQELALVETRIIKPRRCTACSIELLAKSTVYRADKGKRYGWPYGLANWEAARFCRTCVEAQPVGKPVRHLRVIDGAAGDAA